MPTVKTRPPVNALGSSVRSTQTAMRSEWTVAQDYALRTADLSAFAWEWQRRSRPYRAAWAEAAVGEARSRPDPRAFGLERFEDPALPAPVARPMWSALVDPHVIRASVLDPFACAADRIDLWRLCPFVSIAIGVDQTEHLLLSNGLRSLRIDIVEGTLIGCPASLQYRLSGISALRGPIRSLRQLIAIAERGGFAGFTPETTSRRDRWILELRVADAMLAGAGHQDIARGLFGETIANARWRTENASHRQRVHRLAAAASARLARPLDAIWFGRTT